MIDLNIWSASEKMSRFESYLSNLSHTFDIVGLTENWLKPHNESLCNLYGYKSEHRYRPLRSGGGVSLLFKNHIEYFIREDLSVQCNYAESLFVEIDKGIIGKEQNVIVGVIYRPPDTSVNDFNEYVNSLLSKAKAEKKIIHILGDFNINLLNADSHSGTQNFLDIMYSSSLLPTITKPTRVTKNSATLIDNIFSNSLLCTQKIMTGILYCDNSDHFPVFYIDYSSSNSCE